MHNMFHQARDVARRRFSTASSNSTHSIDNNHHHHHNNNNDNMRRLSSSSFSSSFSSSTRDNQIQQLRDQLQQYHLATVAMMQSQQQTQQYQQDTSQQGLGLGLVIGAGQHHRPDSRGGRRKSSACASERSCGSFTDEHTIDLWRCMLELQGMYGCYHSTRIDLAMEAGDEGVSLMPNRFIIDTLNDSVIDFLPEEGWEMLERHLRHHDTK